MQGMKPMSRIPSFLSEPLPPLPLLPQGWQASYCASWMWHLSGRGRVTQSRERTPRPAGAEQAMEEPGRPHGAHTEGCEAAKEHGPTKERAQYSQMPQFVERKARDRDFCMKCLNFKILATNSHF